MVHAERSSQATGFVDAGVLFSFAPSVADGSRSDMMDSVLLAQLAADKKHSRFTEPEDWYSSYANVLGELAWQITAFGTEQYVPPGSMFTLKDVVLNMLKGIATSGEVDLVRETILTFNKLPGDDPRVLVYERFSHSSSIVDLQVGVTDGSSALSALGVVLETEQEIQDLFTEEFLVARLVGKVRTLSYRGALNEKAYAPLRDAVITKLGSKRSELILDLP